MGFRRLSHVFMTVAVALLALPIKTVPAQESGNITATLKVPGATIDVTLPEGSMKLSREELLGWVKTSAVTVADYYGHFPVPHLTLKMRSTSGSGIRHGVTYPKDGGLIFISVGRDADIAATKEDWVLVHEMIHLLERLHNDRFIGYMNSFMPLWQYYREELNRAPLGHESWEY